MRKPSTLLTIALTLAAVAGTGLLVALALVYGGLYNVASTREHLQPTFSVLETAMRQSVRLRARAIVVPPLHDEAMVLRGAACFRDKCVQCHGAPGVAQNDIGKSMQPLPGPLVDARKYFQPRELYWVTRHGIKMSGMPAWEFRLTEDELWSVVAFMQRLPDLNAPQYATLVQRAPPAPACGRELLQTEAPAAVDLERGRQALYQYACNACHVIPGVTGSSPHVGPPLKGIAGRSLIAGSLPNTQENMARWLRDTQALKPGTAMPQLGVTERDAKDIAAYLATLR
ncbi:c-type cytochrome [uncultured Ramlibacter sp.]|uniref:c-type cytochrome n=1 Tax=uncultured Ramlibacter sp. TaxID=260755 RepID=UPI0026129580|nr:c-type cytochrome [uncultured Ramlibacter sp.]